MPSPGLRTLHVISALLVRWRKRERERNRRRERERDQKDVKVTQEIGKKHNERINEVIVKVADFSIKYKYLNGIGNR